MLRVFQPYQKKFFSVKNRFIRSATADGFADAEGNPTESWFRFYDELASGGAGMIIAGYTSVSLDGRQSRGMASIFTRENMEAFRKHLAILKTRHPETKWILQLVHTGSHARPEYNGGVPGLAPSAIPDKLYGDMPREATLEDIESIEEKFVLATVNAAEAGFHGVQIHAAHGYLISQFLSPGTNLRNDEYGQSPEGRIRLLGNIIRKISAKMDKDNFILSVKINGGDFFEGGLTPEQSLEYARLAVKWPLDFVEISGGTAYSGRKGVSRPGVKPGKNEAYFSEEARGWKNIVPYPVASVGGYRSLVACEKILEDNMADFISISRPLIREPDLIRRWESGDHRNAECISCNRCYKELVSGDGLACYFTKNPEEKEGA